MSWTTNTPSNPPPTNIVATIDSTAQAAFHKYLVHLHTHGLIARIIVDEAHLLLTHHSFRPVMDTLTWLAQQGIQIILQSATVPPFLESRLFSLVGITNYTIVRSPTFRKNISFNVVRAVDPLETLRECYNTARAKWPNSAMIVYCKTTDEVIHVSQYLSAPPCYAAMPIEEIETLLLQLRTGEVKLVVSTSVLGVAVDIPTLTHTFHYLYPYNTISFVQEVGRAGRGKLAPKAWSYVILPQEPPHHPIHPPDQFGAELIRCSLDRDDICRHLMLQMFIDGVAEPCSMLPGISHLCDVCTLQSLQPPDRAASYTYPHSLIDPFLDTGNS